MEAGQRPPVLKVGDLNVRRDFTDVRDVVTAYCELLDKGQVGEIYNVCSGRAVLLTDAVRELQRNCRATVKIEVDDARVRPNEVPQMLGDPSKIHRATDWTAMISLESTLQTLLAYWRTKVTNDLAEANGIATQTPRG